MSIDAISFFYDADFGGSSLVLGGNYDLYLSYAANPVGSLSSSLASNVSGVQSLFASIAGGGDMNSMLTIFGAPFNYDPSNGDLLLEIVASDQDNVPNGSGNAYDLADYTGVQTTRAYCVTSVGCFGDVPGALRTEFDGNSVTAAPEPATLAVFGAALAGLGARRRRKAKA